MTAPSLLKDLEAVALLADKATPGEWVTTVGHHVKQAHGVMVVAKNELRGEVAQHNAAYIATLHNFIRTHHAEIAEAVRDARRYRWLRNIAWSIPSIAQQELPAVAVFSGTGRRCKDISGAEMDQAIDAAIVITQGSVQEGGN